MFYPRDTWRKNGRFLRMQTGDPINTNCNALYLFNDAPGITAVSDLSGNSTASASFVSGVTTAPTLFGRGYSFAGAGVITTSPNTSIINTPSVGISISVWTSLQSAGLIGKGLGGSDWFLQMEPGAFSVTLTNPSTATFSAASGGVNGGVWNHLVGVWSVGNYVAFYQNGRLTQKTTCTSTLPRNNTDGVTIGKTVNGFLTGSIDNVRIWGGGSSGTGRVLSAADVWRLYTEPFCGIDTVTGTEAMTLSPTWLPSSAFASTRPVTYMAT